MAVEDATDLATFFETEEWGQAATYYPRIGPAVACTVVLDQALDARQAASALLRVPVRVVRVRRSEIAEPRRDDKIQVGDEIMRIQAAELDIEGVMWTLGLAADE